jgi:predicted transcriptional regulator
VKHQRAKPVRRELTQLQRKAIRILIAEPGVTFQSIADRLHLDRSAVSRWMNHDELFVAELEAARASPRERLSAEDALERLDPDEQERLRSLLAQNGRARTPSRLGKLRTLIETINAPGEQRGMTFELFDVLADTMVKWKYAKSGRATDVCRGILDMRRELVGLAKAVIRYSGNRPVGMEPEYDPDLLAQEQEVNEELAILDGIEGGDVQNKGGDP